MKIGIFDKDVKKASRFYKGKFEKLLQRPTITWVTNYRFDPGKTNRAFKKSWYHKHGTMAGLPSKKHLVLTGRQGPGPLERLEKLRRAEKSGYAAARKLRKKLPPGTSGPVPPVRVPDFSTLVPRFRTGKTERIREKRSNLPLVGKVHNIMNKTFIEGLGGRKIPFAPSPEHKKYWYFKRKKGEWTFSVHHPYGNEYDLYRLSN